MLDTQVQLVGVHSRPKAQSTRFILTKRLMSQSHVGGRLSVTSVFDRANSHHSIKREREKCRYHIKG